MADALLSDIDGTLVDNNPLHAEAWRQIGKGDDYVAKASKPEADSFAAALEKVMRRAGQAVALGDAPGTRKLRASWAYQSSVSLRAIGKRTISAGCVEVWQDPPDLLLNFARSALRR